MSAHFMAGDFDEVRTKEGNYSEPVISANISQKGLAKVIAVLVYH